MKFLDAHKIVSNFKGGAPLPVLIAMSGMPDKLDIFVRAAAAIHGRKLEMQTLPFNTLGQSLTREASASAREVFVLFPWDFVPEADWRSGLPSAPVTLEALQSEARITGDRLRRRSGAVFLYVPAPLPPLFADPRATAGLADWLIGLAGSIGGHVLEATAFSLGSYLANGSPFATHHLSTIANAIVSRAIESVPAPKKVLVTDLDNVMWHGVVGEEGLDGIQFQPDGAGFRHYVYQGFLAKLKREGALLAAVSRNDLELANAPFLSERMLLRVDDFVVIAASYSAKSAQIRQIASQLNLGLDSFVFVDDNPIEIEEVSAAIPELTPVQFPSNDDAFPGFLDQIAHLFARSVITAEDVERTAMYKRRLETMAQVDAEGADLTEFLRGLQMGLTIYDRSAGDRTRAVQLINKTNQFNLNGRRVTDEEVGAILGEGGRLYTCALSDRTGTHGEILSCLVDAEGTVRSLVMSCRVFQRRVEYAFFVWLARQGRPPRALEHAATARNEPIAQFLSEPAFAKKEGDLHMPDWDEFTRLHASDESLFAISVADAPEATRA